MATPDGWAAGVAGVVAEGGPVRAAPVGGPARAAPGRWWRQTGAEAAAQGEPRPGRGWRTGAEVSGGRRPREASVAAGKGWSWAGGCLPRVAAAVARREEKKLANRSSIYIIWETLTLLSSWVINI